MGVKTAKNHPQTPPVTHSVTSSSETHDYHENDNLSFPLVTMQKEKDQLKKDVTFSSVVDKTCCVTFYYWDRAVFCS